MTTKKDEERSTGEALRTERALKLALEALEECRRDPRLKYEHPYYDKTITAIRVALASKNEALAEQPAIPLGDSNTGLQWDKTPQAFNDWWDSDYDPKGNPFRQDSAAYWAWAGWKAATEQPAQPSKPWVGLTQHDIDIAFDDTQEGGGFNEFAYAIEAKLREKNEPLEKNA